MELRELVRERIRSARLQKGLTCRDMACNLHMDERNYKRIESGEKKNLDVELLHNIAELIGVDFIDFLISRKTVIINTIKNNGTINVAKAEREEIIEKYEKLLVEKEYIIDAQERKIFDLQMRLLQYKDSR